MELALKKTAPHSAPRPKTHYKININNLSYKLPQTTYTYNHCLHSKHQHTTPPQPFILKNVNCEARPGELTVIAGPSGAGKTTLLEIIAGEIKRSRFTGQVLVNGSPMRGAHFRRVSGYITQDEALFPHLTVQETLTYSARLRLPAKSREEAETRVEYLLKELGLEHIAGARIGSESDRGISGGEKRRVSIGVELVHDPMVVLLDEPTSGLDSGSALHVIFLLKSMAKNQGKTIVLTIHQPGFRILDLIDRVVLLSDGTVLHNGSLSLLEERLMLEGHFVPPRVNVLEFAIDAAEKILHEEEEEELLIRINTEEEEENKKNHVNSTHYTNSRFKEVMILTQRFSRNIFRTKQLFAAKTTQSLLAGIVLGTIFINSFGNRNNKRLEVQNQLGFLAFTLSFLMSTTTEALPIFLQERRILMRETSRGVYRVSSYIIANALVFIPFLLIVALLYTTPVYWLVGLRRNVDGFLYFSLVVWMVVLMANSFVACFSALVPDFITGMSIIYGFLGSFFLFSGYFMSKDAVPKYWNFMRYVSLFKYPFECFMINEYGGEGGKMRCLQVMEGTCLIYGDQFLIQQGLKESQKWSNLFVMLSFIVGYRVLGLVFLCYRSCRT